MMLTDLADACRKSGLKVVEVDGWKVRGHGELYGVETIVCHHTATSRAARGDYPSLRIVRDGRSDLPGPLCNLGLGRDGTVYVVAAGVAYHAGEVRDRSMDNWRAIGIEAEADGLSAWPAAQVDAYARLCAALCDHYGLAVSRVMGHKEVCAPVGRKTDPNFDMDAFRAHVSAAQEDDMPLNADDKNWIAKTIKDEVAAGIEKAMTTEQSNGATLRENIRNGGNARDFAKAIAKELGLGNVRKDQSGK